MDWMYLAKSRSQWWAVLIPIMKFCASLNAENYQQNDHQLPKNDSAPWN